MTAAKGSIWQRIPGLQKRLEALVAEGASAAEAARKLGHGLSRNAVLSRARHSGLRFSASVPRAWSPAEEKLLRDLAPTGLSPATIASRIGRSESSIRVKASQLRLAFGRACTPVRQISLPSPDPVKPPPAPGHAPPPVRNGGVTLANVRPGQCRFPIGDPLESGFHFCGHPITRGSYCADHHRLTHTKKHEPDDPDLSPELARRAERQFARMWG